MEEPERPQMAIWRSVACWISKATRAEAHDRAPPPPPTPKHAEKYVLLIAFPLQQWLRERASM